MHGLRRRWWGRCCRTQFRWNRRNSYASTACTSTACTSTTCTSTTRASAAYASITSVGAANEQFAKRAAFGGICLSGRDRRPPPDHDVAQNFFDSDGDALSFKIQLKGTTTGVWRGLHLSGTHIVGIPTVAFPGERPQTGIVVEVDDGRGGGLFWEYPITIEPNAVPVVVQPNEDRILGVGASVDLEVTHGGSGFKDADDDPLTYTVMLTPVSRGLRVEGTRVVGVLNSTGAVFVRVKADDGFGGSVEDVFALAAPVVETRRPTFPRLPSSTTMPSSLCQPS